MFNRKKDCRAGKSRLRDRTFGGDFWILKRGTTSADRREKGEALTVAGRGGLLCSLRTRPHSGFTGGKRLLCGRPESCSTCDGEIYIPDLEEPTPSFRTLIDTCLGGGKKGARC